MCVQGRQLALTLHRVFEELSCFSSNDDDNSTTEVAGLFTLLNVVWDVSCSCREAGYPESSVTELDQTWGGGSTCSGMPSPVDVPTRPQAAARHAAS